MAKPVCCNIDPKNLSKVKLTFNGVDTYDNEGVIFDKSAFFDDLDSGNFDVNSYSIVSNNLINEVYEFLNDLMNIDDVSLYLENSSDLNDLINKIKKARGEK